LSLFKNITLDAANTAVTAPIPTNPYALGGDDILALSKAIDGTADVPGMQRPFLPHQAASFNCAMGAIARWGCALIGDDMGLGKTQVLLAIMEAIRQNKGGGYGLIMAPAVTKAGYMADLAATFPTLRFHHIYGRTANFIGLPHADIYWMTDDTQSMRAWLTTTEHLPNGKTRLVANEFVKRANIVARDEMHRDKGIAGKAKPASRAGIMQVIGEALRAQGTPMVGMTGTLLTNRPIEGFLPLLALGGKRLLMAVTPGSKSEKTYKSRYCNPTYNGWGWDMSGANHAELPRLHDALCRTIMGRRSKKQLKNLPHSGWLIVPIALNGVLARYNRIVAEFLSLIKEEDGVEAMWRKARAEAITKMSALREEAGIAKAQAAAEYIADLVSQGRKVVAFYQHTEVHDRIKAALHKLKVSTASINGSVTGDKRTQVINDFQAGNIDVVIGQLGAMGIGVTLTAAADAVFVQTPWSAGDLKQAADRILRCDDISMQRAIDGEAVTWHVLQAAQANGDPTLDMQHFAVLEEKAKVCDAVNAGEEITLPDSAIMKQTLQAWFAAQS
jgi:hypothetical protein